MAFAAQIGIITFSIELIVVVCNMKDTCDIQYIYVSDFYGTEHYFSPQLTAYVSILACHVRAHYDWCKG